MDASLVTHNHATARAMPRVAELDSTWCLLREGYTFLPNRQQALQSDVFELRLLGKRTIALTGAAAAALFYDENHFIRRKALPLRVRRTLTGMGAVQGLDGTAHRQRKALFMQLVDETQLRRLVVHAQEEWQSATEQWQTQERVVLHDEAQEILARAVCRWAGMPLREREVKRRVGQLSALFDGAGAVGPRHWRARRARKQTERWIAGIVERVRDGKLQPKEYTALHVFANATDEAGQRLKSRVAAVEILNVLRPTVAISVYVTFAALALHQHPEYRERLASGNSAELERFVHEVRRFYPFFPMVAARVREDFEWRGYHFERGTQTLLDLYGTNRDPRIWQDPGAFRPDRFRDWTQSPYTFIPQGGGHHAAHHRCAGEWVTIELLKLAVHTLCAKLTYDVPAQDLRVPLNRIPTFPKSGFVIERVRRVT